MDILRETKQINSAEEMLLKETFAGFDVFKWEKNLFLIRLFLKDCI